MSTSCAPGDYTTSSAYGDEERAVIAYADAMTAVPPQVTEEQVAELQARHGELPAWS